MSKNNIISTKDRIIWLSVLQGWCILLVVFCHIDLNNLSIDPLQPWAGSIHKIIYGFHMPLFMFISGFLFYLTRIAKNKTYRYTMFDKLKRLYIPLITFTLVAFILKLGFASLMKNPAHISFSYIFDTFITYKINPLSEMWFIVALLVIMCAYPIYRFISKKLIYELLFLAFTALLYLKPIDTNIFQLFMVSKMMFFFYSGVLVCKYNLHKQLNSYSGFVLTGIIFIVLNIIVNDIQNVIIPKFFLCISGIIFSFALCQNISKILPSLFSSFREYTYQIFLLGIFFQMGIRYLYLYTNKQS